MNSKATLILIIIEIFKDLPVPTMSTSVDVVPLLNKFEESFLESMFVFVEDYL